MNIHDHLDGTNTQSLGWIYWINYRCHEFGKKTYMNRKEKPTKNTLIIILDSFSLLSCG